MKTKTFLLSLACVLLASCHTQSKHFDPVNPSATPEAKALLERLYRSVDEGKILSAQQHNEYQMMRPEWYEQDRDRILEASGKVPLIWGGDMGWERQTVINHAIEEYEKGHIITLMWHSQRPLDEGTTIFKDQCQGELSDDEWQELVTPGSEAHNAWLVKIDEVAGYLKQLKDKNIPVLWRPYHEMNGEWFWWGDRRGENGFAKLWTMMYDRYVGHHHLDNLLWVWNANGPRDIPGDTAFDYALYFPGTDYVDVLATDIYNNDWKQSHHDQLLELGGGKLIALGEIGNVPTPKILETQNRYAWFMIWAGFTSPTLNNPVALRALFDRPGTVNWE
jgi:mannan endo-1,4-beta-mannosidase